MELPKEVLVALQPEDPEYVHTFGQSEHKARRWPSSDVKQRLFDEKRYRFAPESPLALGLSGKL